MRERAIIETRFRAVPGLSDEGDHWLGGETTNREAVCPVCKVPLLLLWDLNCRDPRFPQGRFGPLERLPLYFCWGCVNDLPYGVLPQGNIRFFRTELFREEGPNYPYNPYPDHFERRPLGLIPGVPDDVRAALAEWGPDDDPVGNRLTKNHQEILAKFLGHPITASLCLFQSQVGGIPTQGWWSEDTIRCPNENCSGGKLIKLPGRRGLAMSFLAGVLNDPLGGLPMVESPDSVSAQWWNFYLSVEFRICGKCWTVHARNRCD